MVVKYGGRTGTHEVRFFLKAALNYIPELEGMFEERTITPNFLAVWGLFQLYYGIVIASHLRDEDGFNQLRTAVKGGHALHVATERKSNSSQF
jgi:hypothetical protein